MSPRVAFVLPLVLLLMAAAQTPLRITVVPYVVSVVTGADGRAQERLTRSDSARPGQVVEYRLEVVNIGQETLPIGSVRIVGPVADGTTFVAGSGSGDGALVEYSLDGTLFAEPPLIVTGARGVEVALPTSYRALRWTLLEPLAPGQGVTLSYRVTLER